MNKKQAIITGGAGSVGLEVAKKLIEQGCEVTIIDRNAEGIKYVKKLFGEAVITYLGDASDPKLIEKVASDMKQKQKKVSYILNTIAGGSVKPFSEISIEEIKRVIEVTLLSYAYTIRIFWDLLENYGSIVNISSVHGTATRKGKSMYATGKAGVESLTRALAIELRDKNVRINAVAPGGFTSDFYKNDCPDWKEKLEKGQIFTCEDMANIVVFLLSDKAKAINGETIIADGGVFTVRANSSEW
ncbi:SDR family oxidoreductase [Patescibacteria group bacterium]|nr:SDR family oxidoreductase [Patescibacteria group bacterium]